MTYRLEFLPSALKEWKKLGFTVKEQFKAKLAERLEALKVAASALAGMPAHFKIKLRSSGYRMVYRVDDGRIVVIVVAVGKRDKAGVYRKAKAR
ncbi:type II toxin-antitoxin system RelE/ParE family toxin [Aurantimonas sp. E1-2-R+4]|uniref:type II toxin-antitoxin system RelE family toxin n=1 Tax=Aurantimonas sp. E1-2-R+4 TaxID=3113714 RepID=UPI002F95F2D1